MTVLSILGKWLDGSGWSGVAEAGITTTGKAEALISASHVKCTHYAHQVIAASLHILQDTAYINHCMTLEEAEIPPSLLHSVVKKLSNILSSITGPLLWN